MSGRKISIAAAVLLLVLFEGVCFPEREDEMLEGPVNPFVSFVKPVSEGAGVFLRLIAFPSDQQDVYVESFGEKVITPSRTGEKIRNINKNVTLISREEVERLNPKDIQSLIEMVPGVKVNRLFDTPKDNQIDMRGFGEAGPMNTLVLVDGRRTNQIDLSGADLSQIDVYSIERIEIIRGGNTVLYGDNATGGVINIVTRRGGEDEHRLRYTQEFGSYRYGKECFQAEGGAGIAEFFLNLSFQDTDGFRLNGGYESADIFAAVTLKPTENFQADFSTGYHKDWYGMPGALYDANLRSDGRNGSRFPDSKAKTEDYYFELTPVYTAACGNHEFDFSGFFSCRKRRSNSRSVGFNIYESDHHVTTWDFRPKAEIRSFLSDGDIVNTFVTGLDIFSAEDRIRSGDILFTDSQVDITKRTLGLYASDMALINDAVILNGGVRGEWAEYGFDQFQPADVYDTRSLREVAVEAGIGYKYNRRSQVYANYSKSYRMPATDEFFQSAYETLDWWTWTVRVFPAVLNADLEHQVASNFEIGLKDNTYGPLHLDAAYYFVDTKDEIYYDPVDFMNENYPRTVRHGLELNADLRVHRYFRAYINYTFQKAFFEGGKFASNEIPYVPGNAITWGAVFGPVKGFNADMVMKYVGSRYPISDQFNLSSRLKPFTTVDMIFSYSLDPLEAFVRVDNIFDKEYFSSGTRNFAGNTAFYPGPERSVRAGVTLRF